MADKISGHLEVGINERGEVMINHPDLRPDENGAGHIVFSIDQARHLAQLLLSKSNEAAAMQPDGADWNYVAIKVAPAAEKLSQLTLAED